MITPLSSCVVLLPAYQADRTLPPLLRDLSQSLDPGNILVVDDGSTDRTEHVARDAGTHIVRHERNRGKGAALRTGMEWWLNRPGWLALITMDSDGQHAPSDLPQLVEMWRQTKSDIVTGRRDFRAETMPFERRLSNTLTSSLVSWKTGQQVDDSQCGFRLLSRNVVEHVRWKSDGFEAETEILIRASRSGFRITSAPIKTIYAGERSFMTHWSTTRAFIRTLLRNS